jgi:hypothetical protein
VGIVRSIVSILRTHVRGIYCRGWWTRWSLFVLICRLLICSWEISSFLFCGMLNFPSELWPVYRPIEIVYGHLFFGEEVSMFV